MNEEIKYNQTIIRTFYTNNTYRIHIYHNKKLLSILQFEKEMKSSIILDVFFTQINMSNFRVFRLNTEDQIFNLIPLDEFISFGNKKLIGKIINLNKYVKDKEERLNVVKSVHKGKDDFSHKNLNQTLKSVKENFRWKYVHKQVRKVVKSCEICNTRNSTNEGISYQCKSTIYYNSKITKSNFSFQEL